MSESGYYPAGAEHDSSAPWNERENAPVRVEVEVTALLKRTIVVETSNYEADEEGCITEYTDIEQDASGQLTIPDGWELVEIEDVEL